jgi:hypothetical protein
VPIATLEQDFVATARQPTLLTLPVYRSRLLGNVDDVAALAQSLDDFNIFPHGIVSSEYHRWANDFGSAVEVLEWAAFCHAPTL